MSEAKKTYEKMSRPMKRHLWAFAKMEKAHEKKLDELVERWGPEEREGDRGILITGELTHGLKSIVNANFATTKALISRGLIEITEDEKRNYSRRVAYNFGKDSFHKGFAAYDAWGRLTELGWEVFELHREYLK